MEVDFNVRQAWMGILDTESLSRYYERLAGRFERRHFWYTVIIAFSSTAAVATLIGNITIVGVDDNAVPAVLGAIVAGAVIWSSHSEYAKKAAQAAIISHQCKGLSLEWKHLWSNMPEGQEGIARINELASRLNTITNDYSMPQDDALSTKCREEADNVCKQEF